ncbi:hypothetical protein A5N82_12070 [Christensenella minuta]|uniref:Uncharacterized protein n=1 Tax=Christensenella minuta TaxID=626937 RepID=A0A136Q8E6_9FIRM|nr:hypothetical protein B1H56_06640 [Christensenella minuta]KXK66879.1 hypothetical protein HMPREF3293_00267 [Christensenella minuta]OAQ40946.1 hypothetical protein A5N82_12070 [Christensenella minuta]
MFFPPAVFLCFRDRPDFHSSGREFPRLLHLRLAKSAVPLFLSTARVLPFPMDICVIPFKMKNFSYLYFTVKAPAHSTAKP